MLDILRFSWFDMLIGNQGSTRTFGCNQVDSSMLYKNVYAFVMALLAIILMLLLGSQEMQNGGVRIELKIEQIAPSSSIDFRKASRG